MMKREKENDWFLSIKLKIAWRTHERDYKKYVSKRVDQEWAGWFAIKYIICPWKLSSLYPLILPSTHRIINYDKIIKHPTRNLLAAAAVAS